MKLFKNRGDFYIPKTDYKSSREERILKILLVVIVILTVVFVVLLSHRYKSVAKFFGEGEVTLTEMQDIKDEEMPNISGKTNFLIFETDDEKTVIHYIFLIQADMDSKAYKVASLSPKTKIDDRSIMEIYSTGGGASLQTEMTEYFGFEMDYFADFDVSSFVEFTEKMGSFVFPSNEEIRFSGGSGDDKYTIHINEGEQRIDGRELSNLLRYYSEEKKNYSLENEIVLYALTQLFNEDNFEDSDSLFRLFIKSSSSNITVRDFENAKEALMVFCKNNSDITVYGAAPRYENNVLSQKSVKEMKGYFSK